MKSIKVVAAASVLTFGGAMSLQALAGNGQHPTVLNMAGQTCPTGATCVELRDVLVTSETSVICTRLQAALSAIGAQNQNGNCR